MMSVPQFIAFVTQTPSLSHVAQLVLAATLPLGTVLVLGKEKVRTVTWFDMLRLIGVLLIPTAAILAMRGVLTPMVAGAIVAVMLGHVVTFIDTD